MDIDGLESVVVKPSFRFTVDEEIAFSGRAGAEADDKGGVDPIPPPAAAVGTVNVESEVVDLEAGLPGEGDQVLVSPAEKLFSPIAVGFSVVVVLEEVSSQTPSVPSKAVTDASYSPPCQSVT